MFSLLLLTLMLHCTSLNVNGLRTNFKQDSVFQKIKTDILCLQETRWDGVCEKNCAKLWDGDIYTNNGTGKSCGVATLIKKGIMENVKCIYKDGNGRCIVVDGTYGTINLRIINVYAPNKESERKGFFEDVERWCDNVTMIVGDFNTALTKNDVSNNNTFKNDISRRTMFKLIEEQNLTDVWRMWHKEKRGFSRKQVVKGTLKQSRIDLCLATPTWIGKIKNIEYKENAWSDHASLEIMVDNKKERRNGGLWVYNASLNEDIMFKRSMGKFLSNAKEEMFYAEDINKWWENLKVRIKKKCINYCKEKKWKENKRENDLKEIICREAENIDANKGGNVEKYLIAKQELAEMERSKCKGAAIRSKIKYLEEGEKCTAFFLGLEKRKQEKMWLNALKKDNEIIKETDEILCEVHSFFKKLYMKQKCENVDMNRAIGALKRKIKLEDKLWCDRVIEEGEIKEAIKSLNKGKSPGKDGLTGDFYQEFQAEIMPILYNLCQHFEKGKNLPEDFKIGIIAIFYKNKGEKEKLENYRPISLLNTDYKIITKILANRLKVVIDTVIGKSQTYSIPGRNIGDTIITLREINRYMGSRGGIWLGLDMEKAFDRVEHEYLFKVLDKLGFGKSFTDWIKAIYKNVKSQVKCNGHLSDYINIERSIRQGCPLSAMLFSIAIEPLAELINNDNEIVGIGPEGGEKIKLLQYADDINITVNDEKDLNKVMQYVKIYERASGAKINKDKSEITYYGEAKAKYIERGFKNVEGVRKALGINIGENAEMANDKTWRGVIDKIKNILNLWKLRGLLLRGRIAVVNALAMSKVNHALSTCALPLWAINEINTVIDSFIWQGKASSIAHKTLMGGKKQGGLAVVDLKTKQEALRIKTAGKFLAPEVETTWKGFFEEHLQTFGFRNNANFLKTQKRSAYQHLPMFFREVLDAWNQVLSLTVPECGTKGRVLQLPFLSSPYFKHKGRVIVNSTLEKAGVTQIKHIVNRKGDIDGDMVVGRLKEKNIKFRSDAVKKCLWNVKMCLTKEWINLLKRCNVPMQDDAVEILLCLGEKKTNISHVTTKTIYHTLLQTRFQKPTSEKTWTSIFPNQNIVNIWQNIDIKHTPHTVHNLDFKIRHRRVFTGIILHQICKTKYQRTCCVCEKEEEDQQHIFLECQALDSFMEKLWTLLKEKCRTDIKDTERRWTLLFGVKEKKNNRLMNLVNMILAFARQGVFQRRNYALYEGLKKEVWPLFSGSLKAHLKLLLLSGKGGEWAPLLTEDTSLCTVKGEKVVFNF